MKSILMAYGTNYVVRLNDDGLLMYIQKVSQSGDSYRESAILSIYEKGERIICESNDKERLIKPNKRKSIISSVISFLESKGLEDKVSMLESRDTAKKLYQYIMKKEGKLC